MENNCENTIRLALKGHVAWTTGSIGRLKYRLNGLYKPLADDWNVYTITKITFNRHYYTIVELSPNTGNKNLEYRRKVLQSSSREIGKMGGKFLFYHCDI